MERPTLLVLALAVVSACGSAARPASPPPAPVVAMPAPTAAPAPIDPNDRPMPLDARITAGTLPSGLRYFILPHRKPEKRALLWLAVDAGSVLEDDDQRGLAHFVEHMAFNGTRRFPKQEIVDFLEKSGVRFGADLNASTSFDETIYTLQVPTDKSALVDRGLEVLRDWTDAVTFDPVEVDKERGVVLEEWRLGRGAGARLRDKQAPILYAGSKYADRIPIGLPEVIEHASRDALVRYYHDWYRPDLMAVIAVGDFDASDIEARIRREFASLAAPKEERPRPQVVVPPHAETLVTIETDPEMPATGVTLFSEMPHRPVATPRDIRRILVESLYHMMLGLRLDELTRQPDPPFIGAGSASLPLNRSTDAFSQSARVRDDGVERGYAALLEEVVRVEQHGFTAGELDRAKQQLLRSFQEEVKERDKRDGRAFAAELTRYFLKAEEMSGAEAELALAESFLPTVTIEEIDAVGKLSQNSRVLAVAGPTRMRAPSTEAMLALTRDVAARTIAPYDDTPPTAPLMAAPPAPGTVAKTNTLPAIGVTEWTLGNGARVIVKPTDFSNDQVQMSAFSPGGHSLVRDAQYESARFADRIAAEGGLGPLDAVKLRKLLLGKVVSVRPFVGELEEGLTGSASPADLELMFQMMNLWFTAPRRDESAFSAWRARETESVRDRRLSPEAAFGEDMALFVSQNHLRRRPTTPELLEHVSLDDALSIYKDRFADAGDFTFVFVGNVDLATIEPLVRTYLASLPSKGRKETWRDVGAAFPPGVKTKTFLAGREPKSFVELYFHGSERWSRENENDMRALVEVLRIRLREVLREDMGGVYGVQLSGSNARRPRQEFVVRISFGCAPDNVDKLEQAVWGEIKALKEKGPGADYIVKVKEARRRSHEVALRDNGFWLRELTHAYDYGDDPLLIPDITSELEGIRAERVEAAAKRYLTTSQYVLGVLRPAPATP
jgi:zinc protease